MKQILLLTLSLILTIKSFSQDSKFSIELNYPIPKDNNFFGENYNGIIDFGVDYRFAELTPVNVGASFNGGILTDDGLLIINSAQSNDYRDFKTTAYVIQPRLFAELDLKSLDKLHPSIGIGYTVMVFDTSGSNNGFGLSGASDTQSGFNINAGVAFDITERLFAQFQYDFVKLISVDNIPDTSYNTNVNILKIGVGYRL